MPGFAVFAQFRGKETSDWDKKYVSELGKISSLTYKKLADHDRIPLKFNLGLVLDHTKNTPRLLYDIFKTSSILV